MNPKIARTWRRLKGRLNRRRFKEYGSRIKTIKLAKDGPVKFAKWQHPLEVSEDFDQRHVDFFRRWVKPGDLVIDIGAFTGDTTVPMALAAGSKGLALGLEPNRYVFKILKRNSTLNPGRANIIPLNFAAAEHDAPLTFNYFDASFCNGGFLSRLNKRKHQRHNPFTLEVQGRNLSRYLRTRYRRRLPKLSLVKIDAEGFDKEIIRNLQDVLLEFRPTVITECFVGLTRAERGELYDAIIEAGYDPYYLNGDFTSPPGKRLTRKAMNRRSRFDILAVPRC